MTLAAPDLGFILGQSINPAIVVDRELRILGLNEDGRQLNLQCQENFTETFVENPRTEAALRQCFGSSAKRRFALRLNEGFTVEVIGWRLSGPFRMKGWVMLQFLDLVQARANFQKATETVQNQRLTKSLSNRNEKLEARLAERNAQLEELNSSLEVKVAKRTSELFEINQELEDFTYIVTHDLKVPIINLFNLAAILADDVEEMTEDQADIVGWMSKNCNQAFEKLNSLLEVAKARSADLSSCEAVDLKQVAEAACDLLRSEILSQDATVTFDFSAAPKIQYLPFESASLMQNLIGNAMKYAHPNRAPHVHLRSWKEGNFTCLSVRDNGSGLNLPEDEPKVFGMFKRAHVSPPGTGIALYSIRKKLERYGGQVRLDSVLEEWTEFTFMFPEIENKKGQIENAKPD